MYVPAKTATVKVHFGAATYHAVYKDVETLDIKPHIFIVGLLCDTTVVDAGFRRI
jgi:hypothetical protein